jgi:hypothetical protein
MSGLTLYGQVKANKTLKEYTGTVEDVAQEDDVVIASNYEIKSTLQISDAYKTGDTSKLSDIDKETLDMASKVLDDIIKKDMTDYDKEKAVYVYLTSQLKSSTEILTVVSKNERENDNPHDVLKYRSAVCVGYATTFRMFMQMLDIECKVVHSSDLIHSWDLVKLDDGWYHVDCYNDSENASFINFNMNDAMCSQGHDWNRDFFPAAEGKKYNYILSVCEEIGSIYDVPEWVVKAIKDKKTAISCTFKKKITADNEAAALLLVSNLTDSLMNASDYSDFTIDNNWTTNADNEYVLCFYINYYDDNNDVDKKTTEKIDETIAKAMEKFYEG